MKKQINILVLILMLSSCIEQPEFEKVYSFNHMTWDQNVKPEYTFEIKDAKIEYDFTISLRTTTDYKYNNLWILMKTEAPDGGSTRDPFEIVISNPDGSWVGKKTGTVVETSLYFKGRKLPQTGTYKFVIEQGITESKINEVLDLGFRVEKTRAK
jgi:gliding motility-associated lipoprotein GldH